jgi:hypothetical protein
MVGSALGDEGSLGDVAGVGPGDIDADDGTVDGALDGRVVDAAAEAGPAAPVAVGAAEQPASTTEPAASARTASDAVRRLRAAPAPRSPWTRIIALILDRRARSRKRR